MDEFELYHDNMVSIDKSILDAFIIASDLTFEDLKELNLLPKKEDNILIKSGWTTKPPALDNELYNLVLANGEILSNILKISQEELLALQEEYNSNDNLIPAIGLLIGAGFIIGEKNSKDITQYGNNLSKAWDLGTTTQLPIQQIMKKIFMDSSMNYLTKLDIDLKKQVGDILFKGYTEKQFSADTIKQMAHKIGISKGRAGTIVRTETMRASNYSSWLQNKIEGATHFIVDYRPTACIHCIKRFAGRIFLIDEIANIPPIHGNCACVPQFFTSEKEANDFVNRISTRNETERSRLNELGYYIPPDGSGPIAPGARGYKNPNSY